MLQKSGNKRDDRTELIILGSTGSVGRQTLDVVRALPTLFRVVALSAHRNVLLLKQQIDEFSPLCVAVTDESAATELCFGSKVPTLSGRKALVDLCSRDVGDIVVNAIVGMAGIEPTLFALLHGKDVALANKETMVSAGALVMHAARKHQAKIIPVDSEPSAIYQCIQGQRQKAIKRIILTASGGPFREASIEEMSRASVEDALAHPTWRMGAKISVDSATMMNKGFEVIEAMHLFNLPPWKIDVVVHPQSIIHSLVEFIDHSTLAQLGFPDMRVPIQYALSGGERHENHNIRQLDLVRIGQFTFESPNPVKFPCLQLAREAAEKGGTYPVALNAVNDYLVEKFLRREISFWAIPKGIEYILSLHESVTTGYDLSDIYGIRDWVCGMLDSHPL
ncbi:MAG: 1-deoxy-D-xylulose-5-phosphate reductoisomerase [Parcubacteria group bacterium Gr01-1014_48]|nr:MAG: 1-deoxy-D-xylulose-5-phosphate reductoisomerase [Parcubacteria group bacterium Greene0416_14]TSC73943.1 MAG: 1-deoxy-D-xylulose-5-phosphate reductoisomerase [Parcubacteria group bacterium Gr01-1014_48]TSD00940.1 MAG: 1-deoxy-D-xylulose-5-phosphate reductoisomerase [Parcubacteria group bacterium Greene1014_15]TSD07892.1 MAG: 1-deoxy-D-xylulose-5-phosphate reductoisomerase [Parcubacteria group bacterium Greene0714_4]